jgi:hypothetical protein
VHRLAGEIALSSRPSRTQQKPKRYFDRALAVARQQQTKSWELRDDRHGGAGLAAENERRFTHEAA